MPVYRVLAQSKPLGDRLVTGTVRDELALGPRLTGVPGAEAAATVDRLLGRLRLDHLAQANPFTLSGGEQRRLSVATVLASRPRLLVLDEPTFGQDARTWAELVDLLDGLRVHADRMGRTLDAARDGVHAEQRSLADLAGHAARGDYLGATAAFVEAPLARAAAVLADPEPTTPPEETP